MAFGFERPVPGPAHLLQDIGFTQGQYYFLLTTAIAALFFNIAVFRLSSITSRGMPPKQSRASSSARIVIVLGSGGHTSEMLNMLQQVPRLQTKFARTYIVSSGDAFSALKASEFEKEQENGNDNFNIVTVRRARRIHQSLFSAPFSTLQSLKDCATVLYKQPPDIILTNGPGTGVCVVMASIFLRFFGYHTGSMRSTFIESWARVRSLSVSGKILKFFVDRFIVQWQDLVQIYGADSVEYIGPLVR